MDLNKLAQQIIKDNEYLTLSTVGADHKPWVCILAYTYDVDFSFYFISLPDSKHSLHLKENDSVSFSIFDSHQEFGKGVGLQIEGIGREVEETEYKKIEQIYFTRSYPYGNTNNDFVHGIKALLKNKTYMFYKLKPTHIWINDPNANTDKRVEVFLKR